MKIRKILNKLGISLCTFMLTGSVLFTTPAFTCFAEEPTVTQETGETNEIEKKQDTSEESTQLENTNTQDGESVQDNTDTDAATEEVTVEEGAPVTDIGDVDVKATNPNNETKMTLEPVAKAPEKSAAELSFIDFKGKTNDRSKSFQIFVDSDITRLEIFYTASHTPGMEFVTAMDGNKYDLSSDHEFPDSNFKIIRKVINVKGYDDIRCMVVYIVNTTDPGKWTLNVKFPDDTTDFVLCKSVKNDIPENWYELTGEVKTVVDVLAWYTDLAKSRYKDDPIGSINGMISRDMDLAPVDSYTVMEPIPVDNTEKYVTLGIIGAIIVMIIVGVMFFLSNKKKEEEERQRRLNIVAKENAKVRKKKAKEEDELEKVLDNFSDEYVDDDEFSDYFSSTEDDDIAEENVSISASQLGISTPQNQNIGQNPVQNPSWVQNNAPGQGAYPNANFSVHQNYAPQYGKYNQAPPFGGNTQPASNNATEKPVNTLPAWAQSGNSNNSGGSFF